MLSDREREALRSVEEQLAAEDPAFVRAFDGAPRRRDSVVTLEWVHRQPRWVYTALLALSAALGLLMLTAQAPWSTVAFVVVAVVVLVLRRHRDGAPERDRS